MVKIRKWLSNVFRTKRGKRKQLEESIAFLEENIDLLAEETQYFPVMFRTVDFETAFMSRRDIVVCIQKMREILVQL